MVTAVTDHIKVSVVPVYQPEFSAPERGRHYFSYTILIENKGTDTVQLVSRVWNIVDGFGEYSRVSGEGVVGEQPVLAPGKAHQYTSGCEFESEMGQMHGYYVFLRLDDQSRFKVKIPKFTMEVPHSLN